jgi:hypothetical protein
MAVHSGENKLMEVPALLTSYQPPSRIKLRWSTLYLEVSCAVRVSLFVSDYICKSTPSSGVIRCAADLFTKVRRPDGIHH